MREIGGYLELERYRLPMLHENGIKLDCGRSCLAYLIRTRHIRKLAVPYFMCDSVFHLCGDYGVALRYYRVGLNLRPEPLELAEDEWLYMMNYYGQLSLQEILACRQRYGRVIVDNVQAYFDEPAEGVDTLYTCRKFFGVPDGAVLMTDTALEEEPERGESFEHMEYLLGRFERTASEFYAKSVENNRRFRHAPIRRMSALTENLLHGIDYADVKRRRTENFAALAARLGPINELKLQPTEGAFAYPLLIEGGAALKKRLIEKKIYVPTLWPNVPESVPRDWPEYRLVTDLLPLPCDQRYGAEEMEYIAGAVLGAV